MNSKTVVSSLSVIAALALLACALKSFAAESPPPAAPPVKAEDTNSMELMRAYLQLQEQLHATRLAIERNRQEAEEAAAKNTEAVSGRLKTLEQSLDSQRLGEWEAMRRSNRAILIVAGIFAAIGLLAMLLMSYFQWRTVNRLAQISAALPSPGLGFAPIRPLAQIGPGESQAITVAPVEQSNVKLLAAMERLERQIRELEHTATPPLSNGHPESEDHDDASGPPPGNPGPGATASPEPPETAEKTAVAPSDRARITALLDRGQSLLNGDKAEEALAVFEEVLELDPGNPEALLKKGTGLERMRKLEEALTCYDKAIVADGSMTIAYLYKAGLFNRLERFAEALQCYEQALRTQEKRHA